MTLPDPLQELWTSHKQEEPAMSLAEIHERADRFQSRIRARNLREYVAVVLILIVFGYQLFVLPHPLMKSGAILIMIGALYVAWRLHVLARASSKNETQKVLSWAEFHRSELERQRDALRGIWRWYLGPLVPGMVVFMIGLGLAKPETPWFVGLGISAIGLAFQFLFFYFVGWLNSRSADKLQAEIDALDKMRLE